MFAMQNDPAVEAALNALVVLSGHLGKRNNGVIALYPHNNSMGAVDMGVLPNRKAGRIASAETGMSAQDMGIKAKVLYVLAADPARHDPKFRNPGFLIVEDLFMTETAQKADVVLPAASWAEREGTFTNTERRVQYMARALEPMQDVRPDWEIIQGIAKELGAKWDYESARDVMAEITRTVPFYEKMSYERLRVTARRRTSVQTVGGDSAEPVQIALGELFGDISGVPWPTAAETDPALKFDVKMVEPKALPAPAANTAYVAVTRALLDRGSLTQHTAIVQPRVPQPVVELNAHDAEEWNIAEGDAVKLALEGKSARVLELRAHVDGQVPQGVVAVANNLEGTMNLPMGIRAKVEKA
jgi:NADH-quinone oxidoreductase subunit G